jgi:hypothetical protein
LIKCSTPVLFTCRYKDSSAHSGFWALICTTRVTLISVEEASSSFVSEQEAEVFIDTVVINAPTDMQKSDEAIVIEDLDDME